MSWAMLLKLLAGFGLWEAMPYLKGLLPMTPGEKRKSERGKAELTLQAKIAEAMQSATTMAGRKSEERIESMMKQMQGIRVEDRQRQLADMGFAGKQNKDAMLMGLVNSMMQVNKEKNSYMQRPSTPLSMVGLLRR